MSEDLITVIINFAIMAHSFRLNFTSQLLRAILGHSVECVDRIKNKLIKKKEKTITKKAHVIDSRTDGLFRPTEKNSYQ